MKGFATRLAGVCLPLILVLSVADVAPASDWARFRGPGGSGISNDDQVTPVEWSESENLKWKIDLPGPGSSSPIVVGDRVFVTCWSGYGLSREDPGDQKNLKRHLLCIDRKNGKTLWSKTVAPVLPEDPYRGMFTQHGYASHTPVSDGQRVYVFFGKTGVLAFDLDGKQLWQTSVGTGSGLNGWGTASSPILYKNLVIVTAAAESESLVALNKETGEEVWREEAGSLVGTWGTPVLVDVGEGRVDLVIAVPYEIWGINPETGRLRWFCEAMESDSICTSAVAHDGIVYVIGGRNGGSIAVRAGGEDDVTETHVLWSGRDRARIGTPIYHDGRLHWISGGIANSIDAKAGERIYQSRLLRPSPSSKPAAQAPPREPGGRGRGGFGGRGGMGGMGGQDYSSAVVAGGKLYFVSRSGEVFVLTLGPEFQQIGLSRFDSNGADFSATPAISDGELFIRSSRNLYCVAKSG
ncbi:MAG: outer membrane protein assembly factor BamB family protein [Planctomycetota bacterium]|jgi:outer membrane protein assembly factor BamB